MNEATTPFASTVAGQFLVPLLVILTASILTAGFVFSVKTFRQFQAVIGLVLEIKAEVLPNGGGSMRDAVDRQEKAQKKVKKDLKRHVADTATRRHRVDELLADFDARNAA